MPATWSIYMLMWQCSVKKWALIPHTKDVPFPWAVWHGKEPRSFANPCVINEHSLKGKNVFADRAQHVIHNLSR